MTLAGLARHREVGLFVAVGLAATACCPVMTALAQEMEHEARNSNPAQITALLPNWHQALDTLERDVRAWLEA